MKELKKIIGEQFDKEMDELEWSISEEELEEANMKLGYASSGSSSTNMVQVLTPEKLNKMLMKVYYNPSKYVDIVRQLKTIQ